MCLVQPALAVSVQAAELSLNPDGWYVPNPVTVNVMIHNVGQAPVRSIRLALTGTTPQRWWMLPPSADRWIRNWPDRTAAGGLAPGGKITIPYQLWVQPGVARDITITATAFTWPRRPVASGSCRIQVPRARINPVIIVPGILGSWAVRESDWELDPLMNTYENLIRQLIWTGYEDDISLFRFPYDWRTENAVTAQLLAARIREAIDAVRHNPYIDDSRVDIISHSMGGLVARSYIQGARYAGDVRRLITLGSPHRGAPKAYPIGAGADRGTMGFPLWLALELLALKEGLGVGTSPVAACSSRRLVRYINDQIPSVKQLYPDRRYEPPYLVSSSGKPYPYGHPPNPFLDNLGVTGRVLADRLGGPNVLAVVGLAPGDTAYTRFTVSTPGKQLWPNGSIPRGSEHRELGPGDGTVPISSAGYESIDERVVSCVADSGELGQVVHGRLPTDLQRDVFRFLTGSSSPVVKTSRWTDIIAGLAKVAIIFNLCPVDLVVTDPRGRRIGPEPVSARIYDEIPGASAIGSGTGGIGLFWVPRLEGTWTFRATAHRGGDYTFGMICPCTDGFPFRAGVFSGSVQTGQHLRRRLDLALRLLPHARPELEVLSPLPAPGPGLNRWDQPGINFRFRLSDQGRPWMDKRVAVVVAAHPDHDTVACHTVAGRDRSIRMNAADSCYSLPLWPSRWIAKTGGSRFCVLVIAGGGVVEELEVDTARPGA